MSVSPSEIEIGLDTLKREPYDPRVFPLRFLAAHDLPKSTISRLKASIDASRVLEDVVWPRKFCFRHTESDPAVELERMRAQTTKKSAARFLFTTDGRNFAGYDRDTGEAWHDAFDRLNDHFNMTLPLAGIERYKSVDENPADIKAAGRLAKFYDAILETNSAWVNEEYRHALNQFMTRVLFCMFAEDTGIIPDDVFTKTIDQNTLIDGSDVDRVLLRVFEAMDTRLPDREELPSYINIYPYVNGGLFRDRTPIPQFSRKSRRILIEACKLDWGEINPDIFGSMIQGVVDPKKRGELGMHYTSVPNIMKLIGPLFLDSMKAELEAAGTNVKKLQALLSRIYNVRVFDPACGSGNFLIIAYRELRRLEMAIIQRLQSLPGQAMLPMSQVRLSQFFGIEYTDFATETAKLSLWIAEHQANREFKSAFGTAPPDLPLRDSGSIICGNALQTTWDKVCRPIANEEVFIVGNPPYLGSTKTSDQQKNDMRSVFAGEDAAIGKIDYVGGWYMKAAAYCQRYNAQAAFVATNSICQGEQVSALWPSVLKRVEIGFARTSFKWANNAAKNAAVTCVIVGIRRVSDRPKFIFTEEAFRQVANISPYLIPGPTIIVYPRETSPHGFSMDYGSKPTDDGNFYFTPAERTAFLSAYPDAEPFVRRAYGTEEFLDGIERWCLWIEEYSLAEAEAIPGIAERIEAVREFRAKSTKAATRKKAAVPYRFDEVRHANSDHVLIIPCHYSEKRKFVSCAVLSNSPVITNAAFALYNCPMWLFAILLSRLHACWAETVCGRLETRVRYSNKLGFNQFPLIEMSERQKSALEDAAWRIIEVRENHQGESIASLYDESTMPPDLLEAHQELDVIVERMYKGRVFNDDLERTLHLLNLYAAKQTSSVAPELVNA